jgi:branched-chain amino acid transport system ATP-binding protein
MMLSVTNLETFYDTAQVIFGVSLNVGKGEIVSLLGRNGAGKTTTLRSIIGLTPPSAGSITLHGEELVGKTPDYIARKGIGFVPDARLIFPDLTVRENLEIGAKKNPQRAGNEWTIEAIYELFPPLARLERRMGAYLSGGEQQMLTIGRTLMGNPDVLLLDEPAEGLAPIIVEGLGQQLLKLKAMGQAILFSEQHVSFAMKFSERAYVMSKGVIEYSGSIEELKRNDKVRQEYLMV